MNAIEISGLKKSYEGFTLGKIDLQLPTGCIMGLVGENGAGKTTLIKLIMNTVRRDAGKITVLGTDNEAKDFFDTKQDIGIVLDEACFPEILTVRNVGTMMKSAYKNWNGEIFDSYLKRFELPQNKSFSDFSRGMKMKLAIAVALSHAPRLLILDEPTGGLDPMVREEILGVFNDFTRDESH